MVISPNFDILGDLRRPWRQALKAQVDFGNFVILMWVITALLWALRMRSEFHKVIFKGSKSIRGFISVPKILTAIQGLWFKFCVRSFQDYLCSILSIWFRVNKMRAFDWILWHRLEGTVMIIFGTYSIIRLVSKFWSSEAQYQGFRMTFQDFKILIPNLETLTSNTGIS